MELMLGLSDAKSAPAYASSHSVPAGPSRSGDEGDGRDLRRGAEGHGGGSRLQRDSRWRGGAAPVWRALLSFFGLLG